MGTTLVPDPVLDPVTGVGVGTSVLAVAPFDVEVDPSDDEPPDLLHDTDRTESVSIIAIIFFMFLPW